MQPAGGAVRPMEYVAAISGIGALLGVLVTLGGGFKAWGSMKQKTVELDRRMEAVETQFKVEQEKSGECRAEIKEVLHDVKKEQAVIVERLKHLVEMIEKNSQG
jgi:uncharacterized protein HemX